MWAVEAGGWKYLQFRSQVNRKRCTERMPVATSVDAVAGHPSIDGNLGMFGKPRKFLLSTARMPLQPGFSA